MIGSSTEQTEVLKMNRGYYAYLYEVRKMQNASKARQIIECILIMLFCFTMGVDWFGYN